MSFCSLYTCQIIRLSETALFCIANNIWSTVKRIHKWKKPFIGRPAGRPKSRWDDDVRNDLKKMKLVKWAEQVQDRSKWKDIVEKAKTLLEL